jgi:deoxyribodipyrimidine photolyase-related protein
MRNLIFILGDQLSFAISSLEGFDPKKDAVLMTEVHEEASYVGHHKKKLVLIFSAMRNFAKEIADLGFTVHYTKLDDPKNQHNFIKELKKNIEQYRPQKVVITEPSEYRVLKMFDQFFSENLIEYEIRNDTRFIASHHEFANFVKEKKQLLMENFYHLMRKKTGLLMEKSPKNSPNNSPKNYQLKPIGGKWNYDQQNRQSMPKDIKAKPLLKIQRGEIIAKIIAEVIDLVNKKFPKNFGQTDNFLYAISASEANAQFDDFIENRLANFGIYQDAMREDIDFGFHSVISAYINIGLLDPLAICKRVEQAYLQGQCDLASAEGFIRQIIGWREYVRGIYWHFMPNYKELNYFDAQKNLPEFYWDSDKTNLNCLKNVIKQTHDNAYSHHIQRLMITGNFALLCEISPAQINDWYLAVYIDAFEWVELPNTHGMAIYADGGIVASKPYCASGNYINKMSNFCKNCFYDVKKTTGKNACPFNYLYWNFLIKHQDKLKKNARLFYPYANLARKSKEEIDIIQESAQDLFEKNF